MGLLSGFARAAGNGQLRGILATLGWSVDERQGDAIGLHFRGDRVTPQRTVYVYHADGGVAMTFVAATRTEFSEYSLPDDLLPAMLFRNDQLGLGAWAAKEVRGSVTLIFQYTALATGVDADNFKLICHAMLKEVAEMESLFARKGLL